MSAIVSFLRLLDAVKAEVEAIRREQREARQSIGALLHKVIHRLCMLADLFQGVYGRGSAPGQGQKVSARQRSRAVKPYVSGQPDVVGIGRP